MIDERRFPGRQGRLLFAYLVAEQGRAVPRDELAEALWADDPPATWDKALRGLVSKLRSLLAEGGVDGTSALTGAFGCYRLVLPVGTWVDVIAAASSAQEAEEALTRGDLKKATGAATQAASLAEHPFLPGDDGEWVGRKRRELVDVRVRALTVLADASLRSGDPRHAARWAEETIALEPFRESGYRSLMEAHAAAGNRAEALRVYERCRRLLAEELGAYPSPETETVYRELLEAPSAPAGVATGTVLRSPSDAELPAASARGKEGEVGPLPAARTGAANRVVLARQRRGVVGLAVACTLAVAGIAALVLAWTGALTGDRSHGSTASTTSGASRISAIDLSTGRPAGSISLDGPRPQSRTAAARSG